MPPTVDDPLTPLVDEADIFTFTNDGGDIVVRQSTDGGASWQRGMAIDVDEAPNPSVINLLGDGSIYGNVEIAGTDLITVAGGETSFDGIIRPGLHSSRRPRRLVLDSDLLETGSNCGVGTLTIEDTGTLFLRDQRNDPAFADMYDGPSYVFVEEFNVDEGGTIAFELQPGRLRRRSRSAPIRRSSRMSPTSTARSKRGSSPSTACIDDLFYDNVIDANDRNGGVRRSQCVIGGHLAGSLLLDLDCIEDADNNIDLGLTRTPFDDVPGLNDNGTSVGEGLECIYDVGPDGRHCRPARRSVPDHRSGRLQHRAQPAGRCELRELPAVVPVARRPL